MLNEREEDILREGPAAALAAAESPAIKDADFQ
jgi:hypothetical protein